MLTVNASSQFNSWIGKLDVTGTATEIASGLAPATWRRLSASAGTKRERLHDWAYLESADLEAAEYNEGRSGLRTRSLLIRRHLADGELAFFATWCPAGTSLETLTRVEGHRWTIMVGFKTVKNELGLDHNDTRSRHGWHRHVSLVMLALVMLAAIRHEANGIDPRKRGLAIRAMAHC